MDFSDLIADEGIDYYRYIATLFPLRVLSLISSVANKFTLTTH